MKQGDVLRGYRVLTKPTNADAGKCLWAYAEKGGEQFFVKEFLEPKLPRPGSSGTEEDKERRRHECRRFEKRHAEVARLLRSDDLHAGNLVLAEDFFVEGTRYYKVTRRVDKADVEPHGLPLRLQLVLLRTLVDSLHLLHGHRIVHGDLKPENILLHQPRGSALYVAKLIDFDDAYRAGESPPPGDIGGDPRYAAPEWFRYVREEPGVALTQAVDMFAFGLIMHEYLFGSPPEHDPAYDSAGSAVADGAGLRFDDRLEGPLAALIGELTSSDPAARPDTAATAEVLAGLHIPGTPAGHTSRVRINLRSRDDNRLRFNP